MSRVIGEEEGRGCHCRGRRGARPSSSGKKRGVAVVVGEEEGRRLRGEEGRRLSSSRKKRGAAVVVWGRRARGGAPS
jgi:hypothetical protein